MQEEQAEKRKAVAREEAKWICFFPILILDLILTSPSSLSLGCFRRPKRSKRHERFKRSGELARVVLRDL